jgi:hypothetical protein
MMCLKEVLPGQVHEECEEVKRLLHEAHAGLPPQTEESEAAVRWDKMRRRGAAVPG